MNCQRLEGVVSDLARDQMVEAGVRDEALKHCEVCASCARTLADQRALTFAFHSLAKTWQSVDAPQTLLQNLTAALRTQTTKPAVVGGNRRWRYWAGAVAAILLVFVAIGAMRWRKEPIKPSRAGILTNVSQSEISKGPTQLVHSENGQKSVPRKLHNSNKRLRGFSAARREIMGRPQTTSPTSGATYATSEIATEFLPLGYGNALSLQDGGQIVRVEVPRSTLVSFGLPVNMDRVGQRVKADLLLGVDGSARAIRFVQ